MFYSFVIFKRFLLNFVLHLAILFLIISDIRTDKCLLTCRNLLFDICYFKDENKKF